MKRWQADLVTGLVHVWCYMTYPRQAVRFRLKIGRWPDPAYPKLRNDKYAWRKCFDRNPLFTEISDKLKAKDYALSKHSSLRVPKTLWVGTNANDIPDDVLRGNVVVKATHGSGWNIFVREGQVDRASLNATTSRWMKTRYGKHNAEWGYRGVEPRLFVEEMLFEQDKPIANEYKFYGGNGKIAWAFVRQRGPDGSRIEGVLDTDGTPQSGSFDAGELSSSIIAPVEFRELYEAARQLSKDFDFVRTDLYLSEGQIYFSELTLYTLGGFAWVADPHLSAIYTGMWDLRRSWFMRTPQRGWRKLYATALRLKLDQDAAANRENNPPNAEISSTT